MARPRSGCTASRTPVRSVTSRPTPKVSLNFAGDGTGGDIVFLPTAAVMRPDLPPDDQDPAYLAKYAEHIPRIGSTPERFARHHSLPVTMTLTRLREH